MRGWKGEEMPRVRETDDGHAVIRTGWEDRDGSGTTYHGTWQIYAAGMDCLRQRRLGYDGAYIPMDVFRCLLNRRRIWNETGTYPTRPGTCRCSAVPACPEQEERTNDQLPRDGEQCDSSQEPGSSLPLSLPLRLVATGGDWQLQILFDRWCEQAGFLRRFHTMTNRATRWWIALGGQPLNLATDRPCPFAGTAADVRPQHERYLATLTTTDVVGYQEQVVIGRTPGLRASGTMFTNDGRRASRSNRLRWGMRGHLIAAAKPHARNPRQLDPPPRCRPLRLRQCDGWSCWAFVLPSTPDPDVRAFIEQLGYTI
jgi:hypothetical protein